MSNNFSLLSGKCPVCGSSGVYSDKVIPQRGESRQIPIISFTTHYLSFICLECGFTKQHISEDQLNNTILTDM